MEIKDEEQINTQEISCDLIVGTFCLSYIFSASSLPFLDCG